MLMQYCLSEGPRKKKSVAMPAARARVIYPRSLLIKEPLS